MLEVLKLTPEEEKQYSNPDFLIGEIRRLSENIGVLINNIISNAERHFENHDIGDLLQIYVGVNEAESLLNRSSKIDKGE